jgi:hypothetical protein
VTPSWLLRIVGVIENAPVLSENAQKYPSKTTICEKFIFA